MKFNHPPFLSPPPLLYSYPRGLLSLALALPALWENPLATRTHTLDGAGPRKQCAIQQARPSFDLNSFTTNEREDQEESVRDVLKFLSAATTETSGDQES